MTFDEFCVLLSKTPRKWELRWLGGWYRLRLGEDCPISAVTGDPRDYGEPDQAGIRLGLRPGVAETIVDAADGVPDGATHRRYRRRLLEACGLTDG